MIFTAVAVWWMLTSLAYLILGGTSHRVASQYGWSDLHTWAWFCVQWPSLVYGIMVDEHVGPTARYVALNTGIALILLGLEIA